MVAHPRNFLQKNSPVRWYRKLQTLITNGNIQTVIDDEDKHSLAIDDVAKEYLMRDTLDFSQRLDPLLMNPYSTILRESY